jgi:hypothetical protein
MKKFNDIFQGSKLHLLMFFVVIVINCFLYSNNLLDFHNVGPLFRVLLSMFYSFSIGFLIEVFQAVFFGANKGKLGEEFFDKDWVWDAIFTGISGTGGAIYTEIFIINQ